MTEEPVLRTRSLRKHYGARRAVDGIDLDVRRGEVFALLGPNGAGKTTTVEVLEGYRARTAGDAEVLGRDPGRPTRDWRARIGIVAQGSGDLAELTVLETVRHFSGFYPRGRRAEEVIEQVGLADDARTRARALSGGRRRRLDVALGIVGGPELLFLDEPTTGFDPAARRSFWGLVQDLAADGTTIVLTTHYLDEVEVLADRIAVIAGGRVIATGTPADLAGRDRAPATVRWRDADGCQREETTQMPTALVATLTTRLATAARTAEGPGPDGEVPALTVTRPSLEDIYVGLLSSHGTGENGPAGEQR